MLLLELKKIEIKFYMEYQNRNRVPCKSTIIQRTLYQFTPVGSGIPAIDFLGALAEGSWNTYWCHLEIAAPFKPGS
ncbi:MAG: hypothetical protein QF569_28225 [Candidatus Poribacteria bacterium]|nr:hypothetical protein [Candidatus Poribacteria bacterium]